MEEKRNKNAQQKGWKAMSNEVVKKPRGPKAFFKKVYRYRQFLIMLAPAVIYTLIFAYYPMTGIVLAFKKYTYAGGIWGSAWNGFKNFDFFFKSGQALLVTKNTVFTETTGIGDVTHEAPKPVAPPKKDECCDD